MNTRNLTLTGVERTFSEDEIIVSKTDAIGRMTYVNDVFMKISGYAEDELLGQPHSMIRNPEMPRCVFKLLWDTIETGKEIFAYVNNRAKCGDNYWVFAHVTPTFDANHKIIGYHSSRRVPKRSAIETVKPVYTQLLAIEEQSADRKTGMHKAFDTLIDFVAKKGISYDELVFALQG
jgi:PAS domain S-box-containing protein